MIARKSAVSSGASMNEHASKMTHGRVAKYEKKKEMKSDMREHLVITMRWHLTETRYLNIVCL